MEPAPIAARLSPCARDARTTRSHGTDQKEDTMHKALAVPAAIALVGGMAGAAVAGAGGGSTPVNCMDTLWRTKDVTTSSKTFQKVPGFADAPESIFPI